MKPRLLNKHTDVIPPDAVYIGRPSKFGNPFEITGTRNRVQAVKEHKAWLLNAVKDDPAVLEEIRAELKGRDLVCFCRPKKCHGEILLRLANERSPDEMGFI